MRIGLSLFSGAELEPLPSVRFRDRGSFVVYEDVPFPALPSALPNIAVSNEVENHSQVGAGSALAGCWSGIYLAIAEYYHRRKADHKFNPETGDVKWQIHRKKARPLLRLSAHALQPIACTMRIASATQVRSGSKSASAARSARLTTRRSPGLVRKRRDLRGRN